MRIAYFINQYPKISHTFIRREIQALERLGHTVDRYALRGWDAELKGGEDESELHRTRHILAGGLARLIATAFMVLASRPRLAWKGLREALAMSIGAERSWPFHLMYWVEACTLLQWLGRSGASHVHAHFGTNSTEVVMLARVMGGPPYSFTVHGPDEFDRPASLHLRRKVDLAAFAVVISSYGRSQLWRWASPQDWPKVKVVHCGLEREFFAPMESLSPCTAPRLISVGRLCAQKGQLLLIEAAAKLALDGVEFELVLAGDGELRGSIEAAIRQHGLERHVRITGWVSSDTVRAELLASRALVMPSFAEGLPVVIMEAMAVGRPVIASRVAGIPELLSEDKNAWLVTPGSLHDLVKAMRECLEADYQQLIARGISARNSVAERHDADISADKLSKLFNRNYSWKN